MSLEVLIWIALAVLLVMGTPIFVSLGMASITVLLLSDIPLSLVMIDLIKVSDMFPLLAVVGFVFAGALMERGGMAAQIVEVASMLVGHIRGGLGIMIPSMIKRGYSPEYAAGVSATGGTLGILIPPSNPMLVYGIIANVSISALFTAGFVPGALVGTCLMFTAYTIARSHGYKGTMHSYTMAEFGRALLKNIWSLMAPVVILGGIYAGICTPVEASVVAVWYALFVGFFITKKLSLKEVFNAMKLANISTGTILIVVGVSTIFGRFLTMYQIPQQLAAQMMLYTTNPILILLLIAALLFFLGMFMETLATIVVLAPVFLPIIKSVGIDPVFFGVFWVITNEIALLTPPLGVNLFIAMNLSNLPLERVAKGACPYIFLLILVVFFLIFFPDVVTFLPKALGMY